LREVGLVKVQSGRASEIIRNLSRFGNQQPGPAAEIDLRDVIGYLDRDPASTHSPVTAEEG